LASGVKKKEKFDDIGNRYDYDGKFIYNPEDEDKKGKNRSQSRSRNRNWNRNRK
jgi:hypothetical protein